MQRHSSRLVAGWMALGLSVGATGAFDDHVFVVTADPATSSGNCAAFDVNFPWVGSTGLEATGPDTIARHFFGKHYVVHRATGDIQVIDPDTFDTVLQFSVGADSNPRDILVVDHDTAYVSRRAEPTLVQVDPRTGQQQDTVDLGAFADPDGIPEMAMMALDGDHLFVQLQRLDPVGVPVPPAYLAVVDVRTNTLVDADPVEPGTQAIRLTGLIPDLKMQIDRDARRLYLSEPGTFHDSAGGIEEIDLDTLTPLGFITSEGQVPLQISGFVLVSPEKGYVVTHTDFTLSSHLQPFSRVDGSGLGPELTVIFDWVDHIVHDPLTDQLFFPDRENSRIMVFDATTQERLDQDRLDTGLRPVDLLIARAVTPGEATGLRVRERNSFTGELSIDYVPGCAAADHTIVFGPLVDVGSYGYSGQVCGLGNDGTYDGFDPGADSYFFIVVGNDGEGTEGSYGLDWASVERPEDHGDPSCLLDRELSLRCD